MMKTGFKSLDEIINLAEPQLILLTGTNNYVDKFVIFNTDETEEDKNLYNVDVYNRKEKIGTCKLKYNSNCRKFEDYEKQ